jgi:hypothetical protein
MARGWESKDVEEQQQMAAGDRATVRVNLSDEQLESERKKDGLLLQRTRVLSDLSRAPAEGRYRNTLESGLSFLEDQLIALGWKKETA